MLYQIVCLECNKSFICNRVIARYCTRKCVGVARYGSTYGMRKKDYYVIRPKLSEIYSLSFGLLKGDEILDFTPENLKKVKENQFMRINYPYLCR